MENCTCGKQFENHKYGIYDCIKLCYDCCGEIDKKSLIEDGQGTLYLTSEDGKYYVGNWPGTLKIQVRYSKTGRHNIARKRYDVWFDFNNQNWHGVQYGDNTQICHVKRIKKN